MSEGLSFVLGAGFGAWFAWYCWLRHDKPAVELKIDPAVLSQINSLLVMAWLDHKGLVWMPKGIDFKVGQK